MSVTPSVVFADSASSGVNTGGGSASSGVNTDTGSNTTLINPLKSGTSLSALLANILTFVVQLGAIVVVVMLVYTGFKYVAARGNPGEIKNAHEMLKWTVIGALVLLGAQAIASAIQATVTALGG